MKKVEFRLNSPKFIPYVSIDNKPVCENIKPPRYFDPGVKIKTLQWYTDTHHPHHPPPLPHPPLPINPHTHTHPHPTPLKINSKVLFAFYV